MRFSVATVQSAALNACNQVSPPPDFQAMVEMMVADDAEMVPARLEDADCGVSFPFSLHFSPVKVSVLADERTYI